MKQFVVVLFGCLVALITLSGIGLAQNCSNAPTINVNSSTSGSISVAGENDYYRVTISTPGTLDIYTTSSIDTYGYLLDSSCNTITYNDDGGGTYGVNFHINRSVSAGTYYIRVRNYYSTGTGSYTLVTAQK